MPTHPLPENRQIEGQMQALLGAMTCGLDGNRATALNTEAQQLLGAHLTALQSASYESVKQMVCPKCGEHVAMTVLDVPALTKSFGQLMKAIDINTRLMAFAAGKPDGRTEIVGGGHVGQEWLQALTASQLQTVMGWVEENSRPVQVVEVVR